MSTVHTEQVLVIPTQTFHDLGYFQGFTSDVDLYLPTLLDPNLTEYRARGEMEEDPSFKQLIPYVIFRYVSENGIELFQYTRGKGQGESRLHSKKSVGIGGHICTDDDATAGVYEQGMQRELAEETIIETGYVDSCVGLINDDETEVGKVHLGVVHIFDVETPNVRAREEDICEAEFWPVDDIIAELDRYESWSQICLRALF